MSMTPHTPLKEDDTKYFTLVFEGDLRSFEGNPFKTETPFGKPIAAGFGNAFDEIERIADETSDARLSTETQKPADAQSIRAEALEELAKEFGTEEMADTHPHWSPRDISDFISSRATAIRSRR